MLLKRCKDALSKIYSCHVCNYINKLRKDKSFFVKSYCIVNIYF